jgi:drug/metabolite transporter (DMT)-like permease
LPAVTSPPAPSATLTGIGLYSLALICFTVLDTSAKWLGQHHDPLMVVWARYAFSVVLVMALINPWTRPGALRTRRPLLQGVRSLLLLMSTIFNFLALQHLQLAETTTILFATPFAIALIAGPMLGEWVGWRRMIAITVGFLGVLVVMRPGLGGLHPAAFLVLLSVVCYAFYNVLTRMLSTVDSSETTMIYSGLAGVVVMTPVLPAVWTPPESGLAWGLLVLTGVCGAVGHWLVIRAHKHAAASTLAPFIYTQLIWMALAGLVVFGQWPDRWTLIGGAIVVGSGLYLLHREQTIAKAAKTADAAPQQS